MADSESARLGSNPSPGGYLSTQQTDFDLDLEVDYWISDAKKNDTGRPLYGFSGRALFSSDGICVHSINAVPPRCTRSGCL